LLEQLGCPLDEGGFARPEEATYQNKSSLCHTVALCAYVVARLYPFLIDTPNLAVDSYAFLLVRASYFWKNCVGRGRE
jgi:hypothetical protein